MEFRSDLVVAHIEHFSKYISPLMLSFEAGSERSFLHFISLEAAWYRYDEPSWTLALSLKSQGKEIATPPETKLEVATPELEIVTDVIADELAQRYCEMLVLVI